MLFSKKKLCFFQNISAQRIGSALAAEEFAFGAGFPYNTAFTANNLAYRATPYGGYGVPRFAASTAPTSGSGFAVTSISPIAPTGITLVSENAIEGPLSVIGELPFLGAIALEGALPTAGAGGINYGCGNGAVGIVSEGIAPVAPAAAVAPGRFGYGPCMGVLGYAAPGMAGAGIGFNGRPGYGAVY